jgi:hypothetical protein
LLIKTEQLVDNFGLHQFIIYGLFKKYARQAKVCFCRGRFKTCPYPLGWGRRQ